MLGEDEFGPALVAMFSFVASRDNSSICRLRSSKAFINFCFSGLRAVPPAEAEENCDGAVCERRGCGLVAGLGATALPGAGGCRDRGCGCCCRGAAGTTMGKREDWLGNRPSGLPTWFRRCGIRMPAGSEEMGRAPLPSGSSAEPAVLARWSTPKEGRGPSLTLGLMV
jgi:hypothetical protein